MRARAWLCPLCAVGLVSFFLVYSFVNFLSAGRDDTFLMLWAGQSLGSAPWFVNYNYEMEEISSSIIGSLVSATTAGQPVGRALLTVSVLGWLAAAATLVLMWRSRAECFKPDGMARWLALGAVLATATSTPFAYWSLGGLETPYHALLLLLFTSYLIHHLSRTPETRGVHWGLAITGILLCLVRTEGFWPMFLALFAGLAIHGGMRRGHGAPVIKATAISLLLFLALLGLRKFYTGGLWPNPVYAKVGGFADALPQGIDYIFRYFDSSPWAWAQAAALVYGAIRLGLLLLARMAGRAPDPGSLVPATLAAVILCHLGFVALTGGNWMEYFRFIVAVVPLLNLLAMVALGELLALMRVRAAMPPIGRLAGLTACLLVSALCLAQLRFEDPENCATPLTPSVMARGLAGIEDHVLSGNCATRRDMAGIEPFIEANLSDYVAGSRNALSVISYQAGFFPYYLRQRFTTQELIFTDTMGLSDKATALIAGAKGIYGNRSGARLDKVMMGSAGDLSRVVKERNPVMAYAPDASRETREFLEIGLENGMGCTRRRCFLQGSVRVAHAVDNSHPLAESTPGASP